MITFYYDKTFRDRGSEFVVKTIFFGSSLVQVWFKFESLGKLIHLYTDNGLVHIFIFDNQLFADFFKSITQPDIASFFIVQK